MAIVVSCVAVAITILAAAMVGVTLGLSHMMDELSSKTVWHKSALTVPLEVLVIVTKALHIVSGTRTFQYLRVFHEFSESKKVRF